MMRQRLVFFFFCLLFLTSAATGWGQILEPSSWTTSTSKTSVSQGEEVDLIFTATIDPDWYLYSSDFDPDCGPIVATWEFQKNASYELVGGIRPINPQEKYDEIFECDVRIFKGTGEFRQTVRILSTNPVIRGSYEFQTCSDVDGKCINFENDFLFDKIQVSGSTPEKANEPEKNLQKSTSPENVDSQEESSPQPEDTDTSEVSTPVIAESAKEPAEINNTVTGPVIDEALFADGGEVKEKQTILIFMMLAFLAGLTALLTPCVFPMIPMTVTFFTKKAGKGMALFYGLSIILIYTIIGSAIAPLMGPETANHLSTEWLPNVIFFLVFIFFALSFFGLFEITLPSSFVNEMDKKSDKGGLIGVFFMAFTLVLVSFSCTGPIVGSILVASAGGEFLKPIMGMFAFSLAFAIPFTLFAIFPGWLSSLPKSGGWLNSVKVVLGFLELALAFKFLSIADQAYHWGILDRDLNIAIWIVIFTLMGFYLLGRLRLPHDSKVEHVSVARLMLAIITFTFVLYLIPGLWGAPLKALAGYLPPMYTHDFDIVSITRPADKINYGECEPPKFGDFLHLPHGLNGYFDYEQALACARAQNKPLFIDFTGHACTNCREMEAIVWSDPEVLRRLKENYVVVALYVDDKTTLPESEWYTSSYDNKVKTTLGKQNADLQIRRLNNNAQPFYVLLGEDERVLARPLGYEKDVESFIEFLDKGSDRYKALYAPEP